MFTDDGTSAPITHHYANVITQFITQFITQMPLLKSLLIITQRPFPLLIITHPLRNGHFADDVTRGGGGPPGGPTLRQGKGPCHHGAGPPPADAAAALNAGTALAYQ